MNITKEFINAIISLFRLDKNVFIIGALEKITEDVEPIDYVMFLAFLGDRKSEYERPIESITQGVKEFYEKKDGKRLKYATRKTAGIMQIVKYLYSNSMELKPNYMTKGRDIDDVMMTKEDVAIIKGLGGMEKLLENEDSIHILKERYFGKLIKKSITEKIELLDKCLVPSLNIKKF